MRFNRRLVVSLATYVVAAVIPYGGLMVIRWIEH